MMKHRRKIQNPKSKIQNRWRRFAPAILLLVALAAGLLLGRVTTKTQPGLSAPVATAPATATATAPAPRATPPAGEFVQEIAPGGKLDIELETAEPGQVRPAEPRLRVRVDVRDAISGQPVRGDVWLTIVTGQDSEDRLIRKSTSLVEFALPGPGEADEVHVKVIAPGYLLWVMGVRHRVEFDRVLPLPVMLDRLPESGGNG